MSKVKIQGNTSGTGIFTVTAPATNTDRTLTLPDVDATVMTNAGGTFTGQLTISESGFGSAINLNNTGTGGKSFYIFSTMNSFAQGGGNLLFHHGDSPNGLIKIDSGGRINMPYQPCFHAGKYDDGGQIAAGVYIFNSVDVNVGGYYNNTNGRFTAPIAGNYYFATTQQLYGSTSTTADVRFYKNGSAYLANSPESYGQVANSTTHQTVPHIAVIPLAAGDYVTVYRNQPTRGMQSHFCGWLIG